MNANIVDLSNEKAERLEDTKSRFGNIWRKHGYRSLGLAGGMIAFVIVVLTIAYFLGGFNYLKPGYKTNNPMVYLGGFVVIGLAVWFLFLTISKLLYALNVLLGPVPRSGRSPDETIRQFLEAQLSELIILTGKIGTVPWLQAYVCLLDQAKDKEGQYDECIVHWKAKTKEIYGLLKKHYSPKEISKLSYNIATPEGLSFKEVAISDGITTYEISIRIQAWEGVDNPGISSSKDIGFAHLILRAPNKTPKNWYDWGMAKQLVSDELWQIIEPLLPPEPEKPKGGRPRLSNRAALAGILFVLQTGIPWEMLPAEMGCGSGMTCWRRLRDWQAAGVWDRLHQKLLETLAGAEQLDWSRASLDAGMVPAPGGAKRPVRTRRIAENRARSAILWSKDEESRSS